MFHLLGVIQDDAPRSAALNMAIDQMLLETAALPLLRFYRWEHAALSFGYFGRYEDVRRYESERDLVRRWTGGGIVLHGDDLTYALVIPQGHSVLNLMHTDVYAAVHRALRDALRAAGQPAEIIQEKREKISEACFASPVRADVMVQGIKVAGAAQRRTRCGLLQQGSIQNVPIHTGFGEEFASALAAAIQTQHITTELCQRAETIARTRYGAADWLRRR